MAYQKTKNRVQEREIGKIDGRLPERSPDGMYRRPDKKQLVRREETRSTAKGVKGTKQRRMAKERSNKEKKNVLKRGKKPPDKQCLEGETRCGRGKDDEAEKKCNCSKKKKGSSGNRKPLGDNLRREGGTKRIIGKGQDAVCQSFSKEVTQKKLKEGEENPQEIVNLRLQGVVR